MKLPYFALRDHIQAGGLRGSNDIYNMLYVGFGWGEATFLAVGGESRWQGEQFSYARDLLPWSPYSWALALFVFTTLLAGGVLIPDRAEVEALTLRGWLIVSGATGCVVWCALYAFSIYRAGQSYPTQVSLSGPFLWSFLAFWYMVKVGQHLELKYWRPEESRT